MRCKSEELKCKLLYNCITMSTTGRKNWNWITADDCRKCNKELLQSQSARHLISRVIYWAIAVCSHLKKEPMIKSATADTTVTNSSWNNTTASIQMRFHHTDWYLHLKMNPIFTPRYSSWQALRSLLKHYHTPQPEISQSVSCIQILQGATILFKHKEKTFL